MGAEGIVFDIKQMAVFDGPGIRTTVFLKGCPLRCQWCHNPEGLSYERQLMVSSNGCLKCGKCEAVCTHKEKCVLCGECVSICPIRLRKICGIKYTSEELAQKLLKDKRIFEMNGGGVTFSGGEPTSWPEFLLETLEKLEGIHRAIETCGYCKPEIFQKLLQNLDYILMDLKIIDADMHKRWTKRDNAVILQNLEQVKESGKSFVVRIPLIPGVNDTIDNFAATAKLLKGCRSLQRIELLPFHKTAGAKYSMVGMEFKPSFDPEQKVNTDTTIFEQYEIPVMIL